MLDPVKIVDESLRNGTLAAATTTLTAAVCGRIENNNPLSPLNAISHIAWGDEAFRSNELSLKHTAVGTALNAAAVTSGAAVYELLYGRVVDEGNVPQAIGGGIAVSALAWFVDFYVVPHRLTPGFEHRLSNRSLFAIYSVLAASLAVGRLARSRKLLNGTA